eukprot:tig00000459_g1119.t1
MAGPLAGGQATALNKMLAGGAGAAPAGSGDAAAAAAAGGGLLDNPMFGAGIGLAGFGVGMALLRQGLTKALAIAKKQMLSTVEITSKDPAYPWVLQWIRGRAMEDARHLSLETTVSTDQNGRKVARFSFLPSVGQHMFRYRDAWMVIDRERSAEMIDLHSGTPWETVRMTALRRDPKLFYDLLEEVKSFAEKQEEGKTVVYTAWGTDWKPFGNPRRRRPFDSVILDTGLADSIKSDVRDFLNTMPWYLDRGIPYRRGYLLHGPPGCGKTSFITALAGEIEYSICILNLHDKGLTDDRLFHLMAVVPPRSVVLLEDVDACLPASSRDPRAEYSVTFAGLLNMLDGVAATEQRIVFMTTNHIERLDPALIRPGRVDLIVEFVDLIVEVRPGPAPAPRAPGPRPSRLLPRPGLRRAQHFALSSSSIPRPPARAPCLPRPRLPRPPLVGLASASQARAMFVRFYPGTGDATPDGSVPLADQFVQRISGIPASMAMIQGYFMCFKGDPHAALANAHALAAGKVPVPSGKAAGSSPGEAHETPEG